MDMGKSVPRLFEQFQPDQYWLSIKLDKPAMRFTGSVKIQGKKVGRPSKRITLHQKDLKITETSLSKIEKGASKKIELTRINTQKSYDELRLHSDELIYPGEYEVELSFEAAITKPMHGLYPCYFQHDGTEKLLLATQFESHHAREVFPCIDEPEAKAIFNLELTVPSNETALSNMPVLEQKESGKQKTIIFDASPIMSSYLLAFVAGEIKNVEAMSKDGITVRTWATVAQPTTSLEYANAEAVKILDFFTDYFQTPFPLPKLDQIALPDFESGAMENWGLITYREIALLADKQNRSLSSEQYVSMVVGHELSHQWFGNLVTMKWWDDLWLNESFASLMEHIVLDALHPDWFQWEQYTASDVIASSSRDLFKDVQSVRVDVKHPDEIGTLFDPAIVYAKGGRLLKMMREYIGDEAFRSALASYFKKFAYKNTIRDELWKEMSHASGKDIKKLMDPWLNQSGMPKVTVEVAEDTVKVSQSRFILDSENDKNLWPIPLLANQEISPEVLNDISGTFKLVNKTDPLIINENGSGHMVVQYKQKEAKQSVAKSFGNQDIKPESRVNILNDMLLLARRGDSPLTDALDVVASAATEPRDAVWGIMARTIGTGMGLTEGDEQTEKNIYEFRKRLAGGWYKELGWQDGSDDSPNEVGLRQTILSLMVASKDRGALSHAKSLFNEAGGVEELPAERRAMIVSAVVRNSMTDIAPLLEEYKTSHNPDVQLAIAAGVTNTEDENVGARIIAEALGDDGFVRPQDIFRWYAYLIRNRFTRQIAWDWLKANWQRLETLFGDSKSFDYFVVYSAAAINTEYWQKEFKDFFEPKKNIISLKRNILIAESEIAARVAWRKREESALKKYFSDINR